jgi:protein-disulfide isomerase
MIAVCLLIVGVLAVKLVPGLIRSFTGGGYGTLDMELYVMSQCPYGVQFEDALKPVYDKLGDSMNLRIDYIARETSLGVFSSLHGQPEVEGNIIQLCAAKHYPDKYFDFIECQNKDYQDLKSSIESCSQEAGIDASKINECAEGEEGKALLSQSAKNSQEAGAAGSPTVIINGQSYEGRRDTETLMRVLCNKLDNHPDCKGIPACADDSECTQEGKIGKCENPGESNAKCVFSDPVKFDAIVLNDKECKTCDTANMEATLKRLFPGINMRTLDVNSEEGNELVEELEIMLAPTYLFEEKITQTNSWQVNSQLRTAFENVGDYYKLKDSVTRASYYVSEEARQEFYEAIGVTLGDNHPQMDFFVMSFCPYGNQAEELIEPVYQLLKEEVDFIPHYVIYSDYATGMNADWEQYCIDEDEKYCSMHGIQELNQGVRELCVYKQLGADAYFEFVLAVNDACSSSDADTCWEGVADDLGLDKQSIKTCEEEEALTLLEEDKAIGDKLSVSGSPTIFVDGERYSGQRSSAGYQQSLCESFEDAPESCGELLESEAPAAPAGQC